MPAEVFGALRWAWGENERDGIVMSVTFRYGTSWTVGYVNVRYIISKYLVSWFWLDRINTRIPCIDTSVY